MKIKKDKAILSFCKKCDEEISEDEKIVVEDKVIICQKCSQQSSAICHGCFLPIFKHELSYEVSESWNSYNQGKSVILINCSQCYKKILGKLIEEENLWNLEIWTSNVLKFTTPYALTMLAFSLAWEPESIDNLRIKNKMISLSSTCLSISLLGILAKVIFFIWKLIRDKKRIKKWEKSTLKKNNLKEQIRELKRKIKRIRK